MAKFCANGHQMEDSWSVCPYCQRTGFQGPPQPPPVKTRLEAEAPKEAPPAAPFAGRKTVLLTDKRKPPVVGWFVALTGEQKGEDFRIRDGQNVIGSARYGNFRKTRQPALQGSKILSHRSGFEQRYVFER